jgi:hypothetical protein
MEKTLKLKCPRCGCKEVGMVGIISNKFQCLRCHLEINKSKLKEVKASKLIHFMREEKEKFLKSVTNEKFRYNKEHPGRRRTDCPITMVPMILRNEKEAVMKYLKKIMDPKKWYSYKDILNLFSEDYEKSIIKKHLEERVLFHEDYLELWSKFFEIDYKNKKLKSAA